MNKCLYFRRRGTEDDQANSCGDDKATKIISCGQYVFLKNHSTNSLQLGSHVSSGHLDKETRSAMLQHANANDVDFSLISNKVLTGSHLTIMLIGQCEDHFNSCDSSNVKWECGSHFLLTALLTICE